MANSFKSSRFIRLPDTCNFVICKSRNLPDMQERPAVSQPEGRHCLATRSQAKRDVLDNVGHGGKDSKRRETSHPNLFSISIS